MDTIRRVALASIVPLLACATTAQPSASLLSARAAYQKAETGPAAQLTPADLHEARVLLDSAEEAGKSDPQSMLAQHRAYLALRRAELADAQGKTAAAVAERETAQKQAEALTDRQLSSARQKLADASAASKQSEAQAQVEAERRARAAAEEQAKDKISQAQSQLDAERQARLAAEESARGAREALEKAGTVKEEARGTVITLSGSVLFASGRSVLLPSAQQTLDQVADALRTGAGNILVEGHTDSRGADRTNLTLSKERAGAVVEYLVSRGVPRERLEAAGLGSSRPVADNSSAEGRANNRRVEIVLKNRMTARPNP
jgi:outer membrane protein OmpA-like peptidoglycan-associated protein